MAAKDMMEICEAKPHMQERGYKFQVFRNVGMLSKLPDADFIEICEKHNGVHIEPFGNFFNSIEDAESAIEEAYNTWKERAQAHMLAIALAKCHDYS